MSSSSSLKKTPEWVRVILVVAVSSVSFSRLGTRLVVLQWPVNFSFLCFSALERLRATVLHSGVRVLLPC